LLLSPGRVWPFGTAVLSSGTLSVHPSKTLIRTSLPEFSPGQPIAHRSFAGKQVSLIGLLKEILPIKLAPHIDVVDGGIAPE